MMIIIKDIVEHTPFVFYEEPGLFAQKEEQEGTEEEHTAVQTDVQHVQTPGVCDDDTRMITLSEISDYPADSRAIYWEQ